MHRSPTNYSLIFEVECIFAVGALAGGLMARSMHRNLRTLREASRELAAANTALQSSESRLRSLIELAADAIYITDPSGHIVDANRRACALGGLEKAELLGFAIADVFPFERPSGQKLSLDRLKSTSLMAFGAVLKRKDGSTVSVELTAKLMPDGAIQVFCRDIT